MVGGAALPSTPRPEALGPRPVKHHFEQFKEILGIFGLAIKKSTHLSGQLLYVKRYSRHCPFIFKLQSTSRSRGSPGVQRTARHLAGHTRARPCAQALGPCRPLCHAVPYPPPTMLWVWNLNTDTIVYLREDGLDATDKDTGH